MNEYSKQLNTVFELIAQNGGVAMFVGGCVRDFLLNKKPIESGDIDIAVNLPVEDVAEIFKKHKAKVITKHLTNIVLLNGKVFEITSTRKDENHDGRYAKMIFTPSFEEDSKRRDFTINALYMQQDGKVHDFNGGLKDLKNEVVRFIGNAEERIKEDYLRIWRFFRFSCHYAKQIDEEGLNACSKLKEGLKIISKERITHEILKMLTSKAEKVDYTLNKMLEVGIIDAQSFAVNKNLPKDPFLALLVLTNVQELPMFIYTYKQKRLIKYYQTFNVAQDKSSYLLKLFYTIPKEDFMQILEIAYFLNALPKEKEFYLKCPNLPFSSKSIMSEGFQGVEISKEFNIRLEKFIQTLL